jgi:hypothetical protein
MSLAATVSEKANLIWAIADKLTGPFKRTSTARSSCR